MEIARSGSQPSGKGSEQWFTGAVRIDPLFQAPEPARVNGASVTFEPGARTAWHTHPLGQTLIVMAGRGVAQSWGGPIEEIHPGDVVWFAPGEKHWHGASPTTSITHVAIHERRDGTHVNWLEQVSDEQYAGAPTPPVSQEPRPTDNLAYLATLITARKTTDDTIAALLNRPADRGHVGEFIASRIFDIQLEESASYKDRDGFFRSGPLAGRSVNIKFYGKRENILDLKAEGECDDYLVMTGPLPTMLTSRGETRPWVISYVYLFDRAMLVREVQARGIKTGVATSIAKAFWDATEIYPRPNNPRLTLATEQIRLLQLFAP